MASAKIAISITSGSNARYLNHAPKRFGFLFGFIQSYNPMLASLYWLTQSLADVPKDDDWLTPGECACLEKMRFPKRRAEWRLGRWTAKRTLATYFENEARRSSFRSLMPAPLRLSLTSKRMRGGKGITTNQIEIRAATDGAPEVFVNDKLIPITLSISHRSEIGFCVINPFGFAVGCDVEIVEPRSDNFVEDYFTEEERTLVMQAREKDRHWLSTLIWSAKESALKALRQGLRLDTRSVMVDLDMNGKNEDWNPLDVRYTETARTLAGWWRKSDEYVQTIIADPQPEKSIALRL